MQKPFKPKKKNWVQKKFWPKNKFWVPKIGGLRNFLVRKNWSKQFLGKKMLSQKEIVGHKKYWIQKNLDLKKMVSLEEKNWSKRIFGRMYCPI